MDMNIRQKLRNVLLQLSSLLEDNTEDIQKTTVKNDIPFNEYPPSGTYGYESLSSSVESAIKKKEDARLIDKGANSPAEDIKKNAFKDQQPLDNNDGQEISKLLKEMSRLVIELETYQKRMTDDNSIQILDMIDSRLMEIMEDYRLKKDMTLFDRNCHTVSPYTPVENGTPITDIIRNGVEYKGEILLKAIVKCR